MNTNDNRVRYGSLSQAKLVYAAAAILFLFAKHAQASSVPFNVVQNLSFLKYTTKLTGPAVGGVAPGSPQYVGSNTTTFYGRVNVDIQDTTIQLLPDAYVSAAVGAPGEGGVPGLYSPFDPVVSDPSTATPGFNPNSNYGLAVAAIGLKEVIYNMRINFGAPGFGSPSTPMTLTGNHFNLAGQAMSYADGRQAFISALGNDTRNVTGDPLLFFGTAGSDIGTWDGVLITLPVHSSYSFVLTNDFGGISQFVDIEGQLVLEPCLCPEPGSITLSGLGVFGLLGYAWRARKRQAHCGVAWLGEPKEQRQR